jgi:hypothetical protein
MKKIYLFKLVGEDIEDVIEGCEDFSHPFFAELADVIGEEDLKYLGFTKTDDIFATLEESKIEKLSNIMNKYFIISKTDVTEKVISGEIQAEYPEVEKELFDNFRLDNVTVDDVLDKISSLGIESLDDIDKAILES